MDKRLGKKPKNALSEVEETAVLECLTSPEHCDATPYEINHSLMENGVWLCSVSTMYRILKKNQAVKERRNQLRHPKYEKPVLLARKPNEVWSWDITRIQGPYNGEYFYLYTMIDLYSRYVVGWTVNTRENSDLAQDFIRETLRKHQVNPGTLLIHSDRGSPMTAYGTVNLFAALGLTQSFSRPRTSNDNPYSESQFKTMKYSRFFKPWYESLCDSHQSLGRFFLWYNKEHMHSSLGFMTPETVFYGREHEVAKIKMKTMMEAKSQHPERFTKPIKIALPATKVGINLPREALPAIKYLQA